MGEKDFKGDGVMSKTELAVLRILRQHGKMYGLDIQDRLKGEGLGWWQRGIGSFYVAIHRLEYAGYVEGEWGNDPPEVLTMRGGNRRRYYSITDSGNEILGDCHEFKT